MKTFSLWEVECRDESDSARLSFVSLNTVILLTATFVLTLILPEGFCSATDDAAKKLLKDYWSHTRARATDEFYLGVESKTKNTIYAYALVKSRQHDVKRALAALDELHKLDSTNPQTWRLKTWLLLRLDRFNQALVALGKYIDAVVKDKSLDDFNRAEAYRFAGRVFAFVDGPVKTKVNAVTADQIRRKVLFKLDPDLLNAFTFDYSNVEAEYKKMMVAKQRHEEDFAKQDAKERKIKFAQLEKVEDQLDETQTKLGEQSGTIRDQANRELEAIRQQDLPLASRQNALQSDLGLVNSELVFLINDYNYWNNLALREPNLRQRAFYFRQAGRIDGLIIQRELTASQIRGQLNAVMSDRIALRRQYAATNAVASNQLAAIEKDMKDIDRQQRITSNQKIRTTKPTKKIITHSASLKTKSRSIVTYDQFPLEIERQLLLDRLK